MSRLHTFAVAAGLLVFAALPAGANAATITETFAFSGTDFSPAGGPFATISGSATITLDLAVDQTATPLPSFTSNLPPSYSPFFFSYTTGTIRQVIIGDNCSADGCAATPGTNQFVLFFLLDAAGLPNGAGGIFYASSAVADQDFSATTTSVSVVPAPEPASLMVLAAGMLGLTFAARRRR